jgi:ATP-dependent DNA helicase RecQ
MAFYSYKDIEKLEKFLQGKPVAEQEIGKQLLQDTVSFAETSMCRASSCLHYFGETQYDDTKLRQNGLRQLHANPRSSSRARTILPCCWRPLVESKERHRAKFICDLLTGTETSEMKTTRATS